MSTSGNIVGTILIAFGLYCLAKFGLQSNITWFAGLILFLFAIFWPERG
jgi:hypothetical protein